MQLGWKSLITLLLVNWNCYCLNNLQNNTGFGEVKKRLRTPGGGATGTVRNLRIREDTAKYLLNLDVNSAHYDPKSRSMREDPQPNKSANEKMFQGDNFVRKGGDFAAWQTMQMHSLEAFDKGQDVHMQANPSLAEMLYKQFKEKKAVLEQKVRHVTQITASEDFHDSWKY
jgi:pre-mRNA-processing factor SLU7